jgi:uncharacterized membrane protein (DUF4010 family)
MDVRHAAALLSTILGALALAAAWITWRRTRGRPVARIVAVVAIILAFVLGNLVIREITRPMGSSAGGIAPEAAGIRAIRPE